jgi:hypothetical protein
MSLEMLNGIELGNPDLANIITPLHHPLGRSAISSDSLRLFQDLIPTTTNTIPFQKPRKDPVTPTMSIRGYDENEGLIKDATRLVDGATQTSSRARKKKSGMRMYCRNESDEVVAAGAARGAEEW